ncbi:msx2-interacting protein-like [Protopterus annectens]|uniref:msx2-interacting protein-like n=1 Tax=Protopterus annectens TaxID=7888 RepID=UPI001CF9AB9C|nr:msx2-interacting protein-like [Protopterus annectens]
MDRKSSRWEHDVPTMERPIVRDYAEEYRYENRETPPLHRWNAMEKRMSPGRDTGSSRGGGTSSRWESAESYSRDARMSDIFSREYESGLKDGGKARASRWDPVAPLPSGSGSLSQKIGSTSHLPSSGRSASKHSSSSTSDVPYRAVESSDKTDSALDSFGILAEGLSPRSSDSSTRLALFVAFKKFGKISELQIHGSGESRYGLIFFRHQYSQETALKAMQGKDFFGTPLKLLPWTLPGRGGSTHFSEYGIEVIVLNVLVQMFLLFHVITFWRGGRIYS